MVTMRFAPPRRMLTILAVAACAIVLFAWYAMSPLVRLAAGDLAPDFALEGSDGRWYRLSDYRGRQAVVLAWFPKAFTGGCTVQCRSVRESGTALRAFDVAYFAASADDAPTNRAFAESLGADYPILSDPGRRVALAYGVSGRLQPWASRWTFYIDRDGRIAHIDRDVRTATAGADMASRFASLGFQKR